MKKNQPSLYAQVKNLPWRHIPVGDRQRGRGHGREEHRTWQAATIAIFKLAGTTNSAAACRSHARDATRVLAALGLSAP